MYDREGFWYLLKYCFLDLATTMRTQTLTNTDVKQITMFLSPGAQTVFRAWFGALQKLKEINMADNEDVSGFFAKLPQQVLSQSAAIQCLETFIERVKQNLNNISLDVMEPPNVAISRGAMISS